MSVWAATGLEKSWLQELEGEFTQPYMRALAAFLESEKKSGKQIFPPEDLLFNAFSHTPLDKVKIVILGQDPYHGPGQAHGLCFSVAPGTAIPPSLKNIYKELHDEVDFVIPDHGCLVPWAKQGVLLLNSVLTVERDRAGSHQGKGWERFTDKVIDVIARKRQGVVFMLWGAYAQRKGAMIDVLRHCVLNAPHPSPLSSYRGFFGCGHFAKANQYLRDQGEMPVSWALPEIRPR
jgi:uracil-DNA glycosylase